jgi:ribokinase
LSREKLDFVGFGALNVDIFYLLLPGRTVDQIVTDLRPGGERIGAESEREQTLKSAQKHATFTGKSGGGQAANTTLALAQMGFRCGFLGKVGDDEMGNFLLESLEDVDKSHLQRGGNSGVCLCILDQNGERANVVFPGCNDTILLDDSDVDYVRSSRALHLTSFCNERMLELQGWLLGQDLENVIVTFDPGEIYSRLGMDSIRKVLECTRVLFAAAEELRLMTGEEPQKAAKEIIRCGTDIVVCKRSGQGSEIISEKGSINIPAVRTEKVVDKTGAGDVYAAGFIAGILLELPLELCGRLASEAAALSISAYGRERYPDRQFLQRFLMLSRTYRQINQHMG